MVRSSDESDACHQWRELRDIVHAKFSDRVIQSNEDEYFDRLTMRERAVFYMAYYIPHIECEGMFGYLYDFVSDKFRETIETLEAMGSTETLDIFRCARALFPDGNPERSTAHRRDQVESFTQEQLDIIKVLESAFCDSSEDLYALAVKYWQDNEGET